MVTITFCYKTSTLGRKPSSLVDANNDFLLQLQGLSERKAGAWRFSAGFFFPKLMVCFSRIFCGFWYVFPGYFAGMIFRCHIWRSTKTWRCMHFWMNKKELVQCGIEAMMWQQNGNLYDLNHLPKSKTVAFALQLRETEPTRDPSDQTDHRTPQDKLRLRHWSFLWCVRFVDWWCIVVSFQTMSRAKQPRSIQKIEGKMWLDSGEVLVIQQQLVPDTN